MRYLSRAKRVAIAVAAVLFASLLTVAAPAAASAAGTASIAGTVQAQSGGAALANATVTLYSRSGSGSSAYWSYRTSALTNASGAYSFTDLDAGTYTLEFRAPYGKSYVSEWWNDKATKESASAISLSAGTAKKDVVAKLATGGTVTGKISSSLKLSSPFVYLLSPDQKSGYYRWTSTSYGASADSSGKFTITGIRPGTYSAVFAATSPNNIAPSFYGDTDNITRAKSFSVKSGGTVSSVNGTLVAGVTVSGKVTTSSGKAIEGAVVQVARKITVDGKPFWEYAVDTTDASGAYEVTGLAAGTIAVKANGPSGKGYSSSFHGGGKSFEGSKTFGLKPGGSKKGVNVTLSKKLTVGTPKISGTVAVGSTLKAKTGTWSKGTTFSYQWYANGKAIKKATKSSYKLTKSQKGKKITVRVAGTKSGYATGYKTSKATGKVAVAATPKIKGTAKVGKKLTVSKGTWTSGTKFTYKWYANGKAIKKATKSSYTVKASQKGKKITVKVTGKKSGYATVAKTSKATKKVG
jgi:hypothetical protein